MYQKVINQFVTIEFSKNKNHSTENQTVNQDHLQLT